MSIATRRVRVARTAFEAPDIRSFELVADDAPLAPFSAGSHIDVHIGGVVRQYSLCNDPREDHRYLIAVLKDPASRGGSVAMHALEAGQSLTISDPKNHFALAHEARHSLLFAGGIGITPILCMARRLAAAGASFDLHYCARSMDRAAFSGCIRESSLANRAAFHFDDGPEAQKLRAAETIGAPQEGKHLYVCGPTGFMDWILGTARELGWPEEGLHREYFSAAPVDTTRDGGFEIQLASSGAVIRVAAGQTVIAALSSAGIHVPISCEQGVCGTCLTRVIEGTPEHRDMYLTPEEQARGDCFTPCCSRAKSERLVIDL
jgi:vanillate O-demethylase ferredoxin subunit